MARYVFKRKYKRAIIGVADFFGYLIFKPLKFIAGFFIKESGIKKILVMRIDQIGDVIQTIPFFEKLAAKYPDSEIHALTAKPPKFLLDNNIHIKKVFTIASSWFYKGNKEEKNDFFTVMGALKKEKYDLAFDLRGDIRNILFLYFAGAKKICGYGCAGGGFLLDCNVEYNREDHEIDKNLKLIDEQPIKEGLKLDFYVPDKDKREVDSLFAENCVNPKNKILTVHPFTLRKSKLWGFEKYDELIQNLVKEYENAKIFVIGSQEDKKFEDEFAWPENAVNAIGRTSMAGTIEIIKRSDIYIGNDSGPQYFAAYSGIKTMVIYGSSTDYRRWLPKVKRENFIAMSKDIECKNCELAECSKKSHECMDMITVEEVFDKLKGWMK